MPADRSDAACTVAGVRKPSMKMLWGGVGEDIASVDVDVNRWSTAMQKLNDLSRSLTPLKPDRTLIAVIEMSLSSWLVAGILAGALAQGARHRGPHHPRIEHSRIARAPARQDRSSRHRVAQTRLSRLVAGRA